MPYALLADLVVVTHFAFVLFVALGSLAAWWRPAIAWINVPCLAWGVVTIVTGAICPLTPLEVDLRLAAGQAPYSGTFIAHYIEPVLYPPGLTRVQQVAIGIVLGGINAGAYGALWWRRARR